MTDLDDGHLLLAADVIDEGAPPVVRVGRTRDGDPLVWAFTDADALAHFDHAPVQQAIITYAPDLFAAARPPVVVLNAAGPAASILTPDVRPPRLAELPGPEARVRLREQACISHRRARDADTAGEAVAHLTAALEACVELGDRLHGAAAGRELANALDAVGEHVDAAQLRADCAGAFAQLGEAELAKATRVDGRGVKAAW